jgi:hypothetical protein
MHPRRLAAYQETEGNQGMPPWKAKSIRLAVKKRTWDERRESEMEIIPLTHDLLLKSGLFSPPKNFGPNLK